MVTSVVVVSPPGAYWPDLVVPLYPGPDSLLSIRDIKGLEPVAATVNSRPYGPVDGEFYTGSRVGKRNIVLTFGLNNISGDSVSRARHEIYFYFIPKNFKTKLRFYFDDRPPLEIEGYTESTSGDRFTQDPEMQVSFICPKPNLYSTTVREVNGQSGASPANYPAPYEGSAAGGLIFELFAGSSPFNGDVSIETKPSPGSPYRAMLFEGISIPAYGNFFVSTYQGDKRAEVRRTAGSPLNQFSKMDTQSSWTQFYASNNLFRVVTSTNRNWRLRYSDQWTGV